MVAGSQVNVVVETPFYVGWRVSLTDAGWWEAVCDKLGLMVSGRTHAQVVAAALETVNRLLQDLHAGGELDTFLTQRGWRTRAPIPDAPSEDLIFQVPCTFEPG